MSNTKIEELQSKLTEIQSNLASAIEAITKQEAKITRLQSEGYKLSQKAKTPGLSFDIKSSIELEAETRRWYWKGTDWPQITQGQTS